MPDKPPGSISRTDAALIWLALVGVYLAAGGVHQSLAAAAVFAALALLVSVRTAPGAGVLVLPLIALGLYPPVLGLICVALLIVGPVLAHLGIASIQVAAELLLTSKQGLDRSVTFQVLAGPIWASVFVVAAVLSALEGGLVGVLLIVPPALLIWRKRPVAAVIAGLLCATLANWPTVPLVLVGLIAAVSAWRLSSRPPELWHPLPAARLRDGPLASLRIRRCDRSIVRGDLLRARAIVERARTPTRQDLLRLTLIDVEERSYEPALSLERGPDATIDDLEVFATLLYGRALSGIAQFEQAGETYASLVGALPGRELFDPYVHVLQAENAMAAGDLSAARGFAEQAHRCSTGRKAYSVRLRAACVLAECAINDREDPVGFEQRIDVADSDMLSDRWTRRFGLQPDPVHLVRQLFGRKGHLILLQIRVEALRRRYEPDEGEWDPEPVALAMAIANWSDDLVELQLTEAAVADQAGRQDERVRFGVRALMELDATRYRLSAQSARTSWSRRFQRALMVTLDAAFQERDHTLVAELLEFARVQALPASTAEASEGLALSMPPVVKLRGLARLAKPAEAQRPAPVSLEAATRRAAGPGGWWLSYWEAGDWLYWALIPPGDQVIESGRIRLNQNSPLRLALTALEESLPLLRPDEDPATADFRIAGSPLLIDPPAEAELSATLGAQLLPPALLTVARELDQEGKRLSLAIAPSPSLGYVPWGILAAPRAGSAKADRLLELCDWVVAPSAALLVQAPNHDDTGVAPLTLAVADTTQSPELGPLEGAREQANSLPPEVETLGGSHWTDRVATLPAIEEALARSGAEVTVAFLCHAVRGTPEEPSRGGVVVSASNDLELLSPVTIFAMTSRGVTMPAQVLLQACDTSALSDSSSGEWLTLAPALIAGGTREVITTLYPTPDLHIPGDPLIESALRGTSLREALVLSQRIGLTRWEAGKATEPAHTPLSWASYAPICVGPAEPPSDGLGLDAGVSARFLRVLADAIKGAREGRGERLHSGFLLASVFDDSEIAEIFDGASNSLKPSTFIWTLGPYICSRYLRIRDGATRTLDLGDGSQIEVSERLVDAFAAARRNAARDGVLVEPEYLLEALLQERSAAWRILALLSRLSRRPFEITERALDHNLAETISRGQKFPEPAASWVSEEERLARAFVAWSKDETPTSEEPPAPSRRRATARD